jgi:hypothetical protein
MGSIVAAPVSSGSVEPLDLFADGSIAPAPDPAAKVSPKKASRKKRRRRSRNGLRDQKLREQERELRKNRAWVLSQFPNARLCRLPDGTADWMIPVPKGEDELRRVAQVNGEQVLRERKWPVKVHFLARLMGVSPRKVYKDIELGRFPVGDVLRTDRAITIRPAAALAYYKSAASWDPLE